MLSQMFLQVFYKYSIDSLTYSVIKSSPYAWYGEKSPLAILAQYNIVERQGYLPNVPNLLRVLIYHRPVNA